MRITRKVLEGLLPSIEAKLRAQGKFQTHNDEPYLSLQLEENNGNGYWRVVAVVNTAGGTTVVFGSGFKQPRELYEFIQGYLS